MQEAGVLAHVFLPEVHAQFGLAVGGARDFEAGPAVEGGGLVDGLDGVEHGVQSLKEKCCGSLYEPPPAFIVARVTARAPAVALATAAEKFLAMP